METFFLIDLTLRGLYTPAEKFTEMLNLRNLLTYIYICILMKTIYLYIYLYINNFSCNNLKQQKLLLHCINTMLFLSF